MNNSGSELAWMLALKPGSNVWMYAVRSGEYVLRKTSSACHSPEWLALRSEAHNLRRFPELFFRPGRAASLPEFISYDETSESVCLTRRYYAGQSLRELLQRGPVSPQRAVRWMAAVAGLLQHLHQHQVFHGDLSASNLLVTPSGELILLDWGHSERVTPYYAAPEQILGTRVSAPVDIYALGKLWAQCLLGRPVGNDESTRDLHPKIAECLALDPALRPTACQIAALVVGDPAIYGQCLGRSQNLGEILQQQRRQGTGSFWCGVPAPSGIGKSEFLRDVASRYPPSVWSQGTTLKSPTSFSIFQSFLKHPVFADLSLEAEGLGWQLFRQAFLSAPSATASTVPLPGALAVAPLAQAWGQLLASAVARLGRLLLIVDDAQWLDESSLYLLAALSQQEISGLSVLVSWRKEEFVPPPELRLHHLLPLPRLSKKALEEWLDREGVALGSWESDALLDWAQGSTLMLRFWMDEPETSAFSSRVGALLERRLDQLHDGHLEVLQTAALLGKSFSLEPLQSIYGPDAQVALEKAYRLQLIRGDLRQPRFSHDRIRELCLQRSQPGQLLKLHNHLAEHYASRLPDGLREYVHHLAESDQAEKAAPLALQVARQELQALAFASARRFFEIHLNSATPADVWLEYCQTLESLRCSRLSLEKLVALYPTLSDSRERLRILEKCCDLCNGLNDYRLLQHWSYQCLHEKNSQAVGIGLYYLLISFFHLEQRLRLGLLLPWLLLYGLVRKDAPLLTANVFAGLVQLGLAEPLRHWIPSLEGLVDRVQRPGLFASVRNRYGSLLYGRNQLYEHLRQLEECAEIHQLHGPPGDLGMTYLQLGMYYSCQGRFARLAELAGQTRELARQMNTVSYLDTAALMEVEAHGGLVAWRKVRPLLENPERPTIGYLRACLAAAQVLLRRGRPDEAYKILSKPNLKSIGIDKGMVDAWKATAARKAMEQTPRSRPKRRAHFRAQAWKAVKECLQLTRVVRMYSFQGLRERAWLHLEQGQERFCRQDLLLSFHGAEAYGAHFQEALSRRDYSVIGAELGWADAAEQGQRANRMFQDMGAWWELEPQEPSHRMQDLADTTVCFLANPGQGAEELSNLGADDLLKTLQGLLEERVREQERLDQRRRDLGAENHLWDVFLRHGPLAYQRSSPSGHLLENHQVQAFSSKAAQFRLGDESQVLMEMPLQRGAYRQLEQLLDRERRHLGKKLDQDWNSSEIDQPDIARAWRILQNWHLSRNEDWHSWLGPEISQACAALEWHWLDPLSQQVLKGALREINTNSKKHGRGPVQVQFRWHHATLSGSFQQESSTPGSVSEGFGLKSIAFRLQQVGGELFTRQQGPYFILSLKLHGAHAPSR